MRQLAIAALIYSPRPELKGEDDWDNHADVHTLEYFRDGMDQVITRYREFGVDDILDVEQEFLSILVDFIVVYGPACLPQAMFNPAEETLNSGEENIMNVVGIGMI